MSKNARILLVDDDLDVLRVLEAMLQNAGYSVTALTSGKEALRLIDKKPFDLLVTDLDMPGIDGLDLLRKTHVSLKVLIISGWMDGALLPAAKAMGAEGYLKKPVTGAVLVKKVAEILG